MLLEKNKTPMKTLSKGFLQSHEVFLSFF